jgi:ABC-type molybdate transport system substrate-binding protein
VLFVSCAAASNLKFDLAAGNAVANYITGRAWLTITGVSSQETPIGALNTSVSGGATNAWTTVEICVLANFQSQGNVQLEFAQAASGATATTIGQGSYLVCQPLDHVVYS